MRIFPLPLTEILGHWGAYIIYLLIGFAFGFVLEISGFGNSRKLAAQFYFTEMTVLKVMFSAIVTAMGGLLVVAGLGLTDLSAISQSIASWTWIWPMLIGGFVLGRRIARLERERGRLDLIVFRGQGTFEDVWSFRDDRFN